MTRAIAIVAVLGMATAAFAVPVAWSPVSDTPYGLGIAVDMDAGGTAVVQLLSKGQASVGGMDLFITVPETVMLSDGTTLNLPGGMYQTATNASGESVDFNDVSGGFRHGQMYAFAKATSDTADGLILAQFTVTLPAGTPYGTKFFMENTWDGGPGAIGGQDMPITGIDLIATPEPAAALLVLAGLPLLRRRRA